MSLTAPSPAAADCRPAFDRSAASLRGFLAAALPQDGRNLHALDLLCGGPEPYCSAVDDQLMRNSALSRALEASALRLLPPFERIRPLAFSIRFDGASVSSAEAAPAGLEPPALPWAALEAGFLRLSDRIFAEDAGRSSLELSWHEAFLKNGIHRRIWLSPGRRDPDLLALDVDAFPPAALWRKAAAEWGEGVSAHWFVGVIPRSSAHERMARLYAAEFGLGA